MEEINKINLKKQFLKMYVNEASLEQLQQINELLDQENYKQIDAIIDEYVHNITNNKNLNDFDSGNLSGVGRPTTSELKEEFSTENMDPRAFELYCILMLIDEYEKEQDKAKKDELHKQIQMAISKYNNPEELAPVRSK